MTLYEKLESLYRNATNARYDRQVINRVVDGVLRDLDENDWNGTDEELDIAERLNLDANGWVP